MCDRHVEGMRLVMMGSSCHEPPARRFLTSGGTARDHMRGTSAFNTAAIEGEYVVLIRWERVDEV